MKISAVVNTRNEEKNIGRCLDSVKSWVDEIVVVDMESSDDTAKIVKKYTDKVYQHKHVGYVEPARNFAISKARGDWVLIIDADEEVSSELATRLSRLVEHAAFDYYRIPRKNFIFSRWIKHSGWWPDYQIRFFKKNAVEWGDEIHSIPVTQGKGMDLPIEEKNALIHYHYTSVEQYVDRLNRYTTYESKQLADDGIKFSWERVITKPASEFLTRFFAWEGYRDGLHGLVLSLLQAFSFLVVELKLWEFTQFNQINSTRFLDQTKELFDRTSKDLNHWYFDKKAEKKTGLAKYWYNLRSKMGL